MPLLRRRRFAGSSQRKNCHIKIAMIAINAKIAIIVALFLGARQSWQLRRFWQLWQSQLFSDCRQWGWRAFGEHLAYAADLSAYAAKFFFDAFIATVDVIYAVDDGFAIRNQCSQNQRC